MPKRLRRHRRRVVWSPRQPACGAGGGRRPGGGRQRDRRDDRQTQLVLNLVEPQSSGIGGGAFLGPLGCRERAADQAMTAARRRRWRRRKHCFIGDDGEPMGFWDAVVGGRSVGTPGLVRLMAEAHADHETLPWARLFQPAIDLAESGFEVPAPARRHPGRRDPGGAAWNLRATPTTFFPEGRALEAGDPARQPGLRGEPADARGAGALGVLRGDRSPSRSSMRSATPRPIPAC